MSRICFYFTLVFTLIGSSLLPASAQSLFSKQKGISKVPERGIVLIAGGGLAAVKSDICGSWGCNNFGPNISVGALYKMTPFFGLSGSIDYNRLGATEKDPYRPLNVTFQSEVIEVSATAVLNLLDSYAGSGNYRSLRKRFLVPYIRAGIGLIYYTPTSFPGEGNLNDSQVTYDPLRKYPAVAAVVPVAGGLRFRLNDEISLAGELIYHVTTTDYLDNIEIRTGSLSYKDHYGVAAIKVMYTPVIKNKILTRKY